MKTKIQKQSEATERNAAWSDLTPKQQLASLDARLGKGVGAKKQRARIVNRIVAESGVLAGPDPYHITDLPPSVRLAIAYGAGKSKVKELMSHVGTTD